MSYIVQERLRPRKLEGISEDQIEQHWALYKGYVAGVNGLLEELTRLEAGSRAWAELKRRAGFEWSGMVLHELYFGNLAAGKRLREGGALAAALEREWGSLDAWRTDFARTGATRGIGWAFLAHDPAVGRLFNWWVTEHEQGHGVCLNPILVMDVFEHAYMVDRGASGRGAYIEAFLANVDWDVVEQRYGDSIGGLVVRRH